MPPSLGFPQPACYARLDGLYGDAAPLIDVLTAGRGRVCQKSCLPSAGTGGSEASTSADPGSGEHASEIRGMTRALYDCPAVPLTTAGPEGRRARPYSWRHALFSLTLRP